MARPGGPVGQSIAAQALPGRVARSCALSWEAGRIRFADSQRAPLLERLGVKTVGDELYSVPYRYIDLTEVKPVAQADVGAEATVLVTIDRVALKRPRPKMSIVELSCYDDTGVVVVTYFGQPWLASRFKRGQRVAFSGKIGFSYGFKRMSSPFSDVLEEAQGSQAQAAEAPRQRVRMLPLHHVTDGLSQQWARRIAASAVEDFSGVCDFWPARVRARAGVMPLARALRSAHFPLDADDAEAARERLAFDEAGLLQVALAARRDASLPGVRPVAHVVDGPHARAVRAATPFPLTRDQESAVADILADMAAPRPMCRMLLGDVGCGKTAVATLAVAAVADTGTQAAVMAPTGVLAAQYAEKVGPLLGKAGVTWALLTGATPAREREAMLGRLASGELSVLFGTHALLTSDVEFHRLSLVVVDEQQRFGVGQRHALREKGRGADLLVMTATPIPRTLALSLYGDLDLSYLRERPVKGAGVATRVIPKRDRGDAYEAMRAELRAGRQAYVVCPLVGTSPEKDGEGRTLDSAAGDVAEGLDPSDPKAAEQEAAALARGEFREFSVGLLTGRMKPDEKLRVMGDFKAGRIQVLVSTTVVEVGVDVPNATVMLIEDGERFGLAQLHQLRGRVGRGAFPGTVFIAADARSESAKARMRALESTSDGFKLAEEDLRLRREGDILGARQSGDSQLRFIDLARDEELVARANECARAVMADDPQLSDVQGRPLRAEVIRRYGDVFKVVGGG